MKRYMLTFSAILISTFLMAQKEVDVNLNVGEEGGGGGIFTTWYFWVGVGVFILLLVALTSGRRRAD